MLMIADLHRRGDRATCSPSRLSNRPRAFGRLAAWGDAQLPLQAHAPAGWPGCRSRSSSRGSSGPLSACGSESVAALPVQGRRADQSARPARSGSGTTFSAQPRRRPPTIASVCLIQLSSVTHTFDMNQCAGTAVVDLVTRRPRPSPCPLTAATCRPNIHAVHCQRLPHAHMRADRPGQDNIRMAVAASTFQQPSTSHQPTAPVSDRRR